MSQHITCNLSFMFERKTIYTEMRNVSNQITRKFYLSDDTTLHSSSVLQKRLNYTITLAFMSFKFYSSLPHISSRMENLFQKKFNFLFASLNIATSMFLVFLQPLQNLTELYKQLLLSSLSEGVLPSKIFYIFCSSLL